MRTGGALAATRPGILVGLPFAASLLAILGVHEFGHYTLGRRHGMPVSLPYFIPVPPVPFMPGTLGAVIRLRGRHPRPPGAVRHGVAGPLAGLVVADPRLRDRARAVSVVREPAPGPRALTFGWAIRSCRS